MDTPEEEEEDTRIRLFGWVNLLNPNYRQILRFEFKSDGGCTEEEYTKSNLTQVRLEGAFLSPSFNSHVNPHVEE